MGDWHGPIIIREGKNFNRGPAYHDGQNIFFDMTLGKKVDAGETSTNGTLIDIDGTVTNGLFIDNDGTMTTGIKIDGGTRSMTLAPETDATGGGYGIKLTTSSTFQAVAAYKALQVEHTHTPSAAGTGCPIAIVGKMTLAGDNTGANAYPGLGWGVQGQIHLADSVTIDDGDYGNGAIYAGLRGCVTGGTSGTFTEGHVTCCYLDMQAVSGVSDNGDFKTSLIYANAQQGASITSIDYGLWITSNVAASSIVSGITMDVNMTRGITMSGAMTDGILISGACGDNGIEITGACTGAGLLIGTGTTGTGIEIGNNTTTGLQIGDSTTGVLLDGDFTTGISIKAEAALTDALKIDAETSMTITDAIEITGAGTVTNGINFNVSGTLTTAIDICASTTGIDFTGLVSSQVIDYTTTTSVGETTDAHLIRYGTSASPIVYAPSTAGSHSGIQMYMTAEDVPTGLSLAAVRAKVTYTGSGGSKATAYGGLFWVKLNCTSAGYTGDYIGGTPAGVQGVIEIPSGAVALSANEHQWLAGVVGEVRPLGTITKTGVISGLRAVLNANTSGYTAGVLAGVHVGAYGGTAHTGVLVLPHVGSTFTTGLHLDSQYGTITTGISVGSCTTGINIEGTVTLPLGIGSTTALTTATTGRSAIKVQSDFTGDGYHVPIWCTSRLTGDGATYGSTYAVRGHAEIEGTQTTQGTAQYVFGVHGRVDNTGTVYNTSAFMGGVCAQVLDGGTYTAVQNLSCLWADWQFTGTVSAGETQLLRLTHNGAGHTLDSFIYVYGANAADYFMKFHNTMTGNWSDTGTTEGEECVGHLKVRFNNADAYINVFSDNS